MVQHLIVQHQKQLHWKVYSVSLEIMIIATKYYFYYYFTAAQQSAQYVIR